MNGIKFKRISLLEVAEGLDDENKKLFLSRLERKTLQELGDERGLTRERIRQKLARIYEKIPEVEEDKYKSIFEEYNFESDEFTTIFEEEKYGKYKPAKIQNKMRNHPLGFNLYGLDKAKDRIKETGIAMVFESEKSVLQCINYLGTKSNIAVSMCGSTLSNYQFQLLRDAGAEKICIGIDKDYHILYDEDYFRILQKIDKMYNKYSGIADISFMFDIKGLTGYKCSPTDCGKEIFL